jgi:uncharacterized protein with HEPN domain
MPHGRAAREARKRQREREREINRAKGIKRERDNIARTAKRLENLKDHALETNIPLPHNYAIRLLKLIARIARHDIANRNYYGEEVLEKRAGSLGNLARITNLFIKDSARLIPYNPSQEYKAGRHSVGYAGTSIFEDLAYLTLSDICPRTDPFQTVLFELKNEENEEKIYNILDTICPSLEIIANTEISEYERNNRGLPPLRTSRAIRTQYSNHRTLFSLFVLTSFYKERTHIQSAIQAINNIINVPLGAALPENQLLANKRALLRCLTIVGEAFTQTNLTPATRRLGTLSQNEFQLFKNIRDRVAHNEEDIHSNNINRFIINNDMQPFIYEVTLLINELIQILNTLVQLQAENTLDNHYMGPLIAPVPTPLAEPFPQMRAFLNTQTQSSAQYLEDKTMHPAEFTPLAMAIQINIELEEIATLVNLLPGHATLDDPHPDEVLFTSIAPPLFARWQQRVPALIPAIEVINQLALRQGNMCFIEIPKNNAQEDNTTAQQFLSGNINDITNRLQQYSRKLQFVNALRNNPYTKLAIEYHIGRLVKFLNVIPPAQLANLIAPRMQEPNIRAFRNAIQHDSIELHLMGVPMEMFICHYLAPITRALPLLLQPLYQHGPAPGPNPLLGNAPP